MLDAKDTVDRSAGGMTSDNQSMDNQK
jgi:hypothetical protein